MSVVLFILFIIGFFITIGCTFVLYKENKREDYIEKNMYNKIDEKRKLAVDEIHDLYMEFDEITTDVLKDIDTKHNDINVLYDIMKNIEHDIKSDSNMKKYRHKEENVNFDNYHNSLGKLLYDESVIVERSEFSGKHIDNELKIVDDILDFNHELDNEFNLDDVKENSLMNKTPKIVSDKNSMKTDKVLMYAKEGLDSIAIAKLLNIGKGEVDLIIGLKGD
ncbi:MAG: DUF6115 domain-containing protein [Lachnospirales bacterium]